MEERYTGVRENYTGRSIAHIAICSGMSVPLTLATLMKGFLWLHSENEADEQRRKRELFRASGLIKDCLVNVVEDTMCLLGIDKYLIS